MAGVVLRRNPAAQERTHPPNSEAGDRPAAEVQQPKLALSLDTRVLKNNLPCGIMLAQIRLHDLKPQAFSAEHDA